MIKKIVILTLLVWGLVVFYQNFLASTFEPFFQKHTDEIDFFQLRAPSLDKIEEELN